MDITKILEYALEREYEGKRFFVENAGRLQNGYQSSRPANAERALAYASHFWRWTADSRAAAPNTKLSGNCRPALS